MGDLSAGGALVPVMEKFYFTETNIDSSSQ